MCICMSVMLGMVTVSIDVPWGQISGKAWGSPSGQPILSLHGMDYNLLSLS